MYTEMGATTFGRVWPYPTKRNVQLWPCHSATRGSVTRAPEDLIHGSKTKTAQLYVDGRMNK